MVAEGIEGSVVRLAWFVAALACAAAAAAHEPDPAVSCPTTQSAAIAYREHSELCSLAVAEVQRFAFDGAAGDVVRIIVRSEAPRFDPVVSLPAPLGTLVGTLGCDGGAAPDAGTLCSLSFGDVELPETGSYTLDVSDAGGDEGGAYRLQLERIPPPVAGVVLINQLFFDVDALNVGTDVDFFALEGAVGERIRITVEALTQPFDPRLEVWRESELRLLDASCDGGTATVPLPLCSVVEEVVLDDLQPIFIGVSDLGSDESGTFRIITEYLPAPAGGVCAFVALVVLAELRKRRVARA